MPPACVCDGSIAARVGDLTSNQLYYLFVAHFGSSLLKLVILAARCKLTILSFAPPTHTHAHCQAGGRHY